MIEMSRAADRRGDRCRSAAPVLRRPVPLCPLAASTLAILLFLLPALLPAQERTIDSSKFDVPVHPDSVDRPATPEIDTLGGDSIRVGVSPSGRDEAIVYSADSIIFSLDRKRAFLYGDADVRTGDDRLRAAYIEIDFERSELFASVRIDPQTGEEIGIPILNYAGEEMSALTLRYNFKTGRGVSTAAEIAIEEGFIQVERFKRVSPDIIFAENGRFTTCDAPHPHYYFEADRMKLESDEMIFADEIKLYIEDVPFISLPIGFFFALGGGRNSGILLPSFGQSNLRGLEIEGLGYFLIINDYLDTKFTTDIYSRGGYNFDNETRFRLRGKVERSDLSTRLAFTRSDPDEPFERSLILRYGHNQRFGRNTTLSGNLFYTTTKDPFRKTNPETPVVGAGEITNDPTGADLDPFDDVTTQKVESRLAFSSVVSPFGIDLPYTLNYSRDVNIVTNEVEPEEYVAQVSPRAWTPFARSGPEVLSTLALRLSPRYRRNFVRTDTIPGGGFRNVHTAQGISLSPSISLNPKFGYFTVSPQLTTNSSIFFRRIQKQTTAQGEIDTTYYDGLYVPFWYSYGVRISTNLYGVVQPRIFGINAIRHRLAPSIGLQINPDFSRPEYGYYDEFFNPITGEVERYSIFQADRIAAPVPDAGEARSITWGLDNSFEAKIAQGDTVPDRKVTLLNVTLNGAYNLADSLKPIRNISATAFTNLARVGNFSASATLTPYRRDTIDPITERTPSGQVGRTIPFPWVRVTNANFTFSTTLSNEGFRTDRFLSDPDDSLGVRRHRFGERGNRFGREGFYGRYVRGDDAFRVPWDLTFSGTYTLTPLEDSVTTNFFVNTNVRFSLTPTTDIIGSGSYDLQAGRFNVPSLTLVKDLHDWIMRVTYAPSGYAEGFTVSIGFKPSLLRDLEQEFRF